MTNNDPKKNTFDEAIVIDCHASASEGWHDRLERSGVTAIQIPPTFPWDNTGQALQRIAHYQKLVLCEPRLDIVRTVDDIYRCKAEGRVGFILCTLDTFMLGWDLSLVEAFHSAGIRVMQLCYDRRNLAVDGCREETNAGLSEFGKSLIREMNMTGMQINIRTCGVRSSLEAIDFSETPCMIDHANPSSRTLEGFRNVTDEQIIALSNRGGVIALVPLAGLCAVAEGQPPTIDDYIGHIEYVVDLVGIDHVAIGSDTEATPGSFPLELAVGQANIAMKDKTWSGPSGGKRHMGEMSLSEAAFALEEWGIHGAQGIDSMAEFPNLSDRLLKRGWSDEDLKKLLGGNILRVYEHSWGARKY